jgi:hypothetical protein
VKRWLWLGGLVAAVYGCMLSGTASSAPSSLPKDSIRCDSVADTLSPNRSLEPLPPHSRQNRRCVQTDRYLHRLAVSLEDIRTRLVRGGRPTGCAR